MTTARQGPPRCAHGRFMQFGRVFVCDVDGGRHACRCELRIHVTLEHMPPSALTAAARRQRRKQFA